MKKAKQFFGYSALGMAVILFAEIVVFQEKTLDTRFWLKNIIGSFLLTAVLLLVSNANNKKEVQKERS